MLKALISQAPISWLYSPSCEHPGVFLSHSHVPRMGQSPVITAHLKIRPTPNPWFCKLSTRCWVYCCLIIKFILLCSFVRGIPLLITQLWVPHLGTGRTWERLFWFANNHSRGFYYWHNALLVTMERGFLSSGGYHIIKEKGKITLCFVIFYAHCSELVPFYYVKLIHKTDKDCT